MRRTAKNGSTLTTSYIPLQFAKIGKTLRLRNEQGRWVDGWVVEIVGHTIVDGDGVPNYRKAIRNHRKQTGDSLTRRTG
jgi:hypothetical protein